MWTGSRKAMHRDVPRGFGSRLHQFRSVSAIFSPSPFSITVFERVVRAIFDSLRRNIGQRWMSDHHMVARFRCCIKSVPTTTALDAP